MNLNYILKILKNKVGIMALTLLLTLAVYPVFFYKNRIEWGLTDPTLWTTFNFEVCFIRLQSIGLIIYPVAIVAAISIFSYLFKREKSDFFHSLAMKRSKLLFMNFVSGCFILLVPFTIGYSVLILRCLPVVEQLPQNFIGALFVSYIFSVVIIVFIFTIIMFCATYAGSIASTFVMFYTVFIAPFLCIIAGFCMLDRFLLGYAASRLQNFVSSLVEKSQMLGGGLKVEDIIFLSVVISMMTVVIYFFANRSYKNRKSESSSKIFTSNVFKNVFMFSALFIGTAFTLYFVDSWTYFIATICSIVLFVLITSFLDSFKAVLSKKSIMKYVAFFVTMATTIVVLYSGLLGNEKLPESSDIAGVVVADQYGHMNVSYSDDYDDRMIREPENIEIVLEMQEAIISEIAYPVGSGSTNQNKLVITYYLEDGSEKQYMYAFEDIPESVMSEFVNTQENKENLFYFLEGDYVINEIDCSGYYWTNDLDSPELATIYNEVEVVFLQPEVTEGLFEAVRLDIMNDSEMPVKCFDYEVLQNEKPMPEEILFTINFVGYFESDPDETFRMKFVIKDSYTNTLTYIDQTLQENFNQGIEDFWVKGTSAE